MSGILKSLHGRALGLDVNDHLNCPGGFNSGPQDQLDMAAGTGITTGTGTIVRHAVVRLGDIIHTQILIDLAGLQSATSDNDVIGVAATALPCHFGQITAARNGTIFGGQVTCLEVAASLDDVNFYSAAAGTWVHEDSITADTAEVSLVNAAGAWTLGERKAMSGVPPADQYLYVTNGGIDTADPFVSGKFLIEMVGYAA